jgi:16S rRNA (uracil1498-N3)-methyltransferase
MATLGAGRGAGPERAWHAPLPAAGEVTLAPEESAHLVRVRRVRAGEEVVLFDGAGATRRARLVAADPRAAVLRIEGDAPDREPARALVLAVSPPEPARADDLVQALAWLGVTRLVPLLCERTPRGRAELVLRRRARWERLAREAAKGSGRSRLLAVAEPRSLAHLLAEPPAEGLVLLDPDPAAIPLLRALPEGRAAPWLLVGPEGGFTSAEVGAATRVGAAVARLSATALRVELAALAAASVALAAGENGPRGASDAGPPFA